MPARRPRRLVWPGVLAVGALLTAWAAPAAAVEPPSWSDVEDARRSTASTTTMIRTLERTLDVAESEAAAQSTAALELAADAADARAAADAAGERAVALAAERDAVLTELGALQDRLGAVAAERYRNGTAAMPVRLLTASDPDSLLTHLGLLDRLTATWSGMLGQAERSARTAEALHAQAEDARQTQEAAATAAEERAAAAQAAADAEAATVAVVRGQVETLYAQLAALKRTDAEAERAARLARQAANTTAAGTGGPSGTGGGSGQSGSGSNGGSGSGGAGAGAGSAPTGVTVDPAGAKAYARTAVARYGWGDDQYQCLVLLWNRESGWRADALNRSSGAYGIPQSLPAEKMAAAGADWRTNGNTQIEWGLSYITGRYGSPCAAWDHSQRTGWY
ncbi:aggregation-promoting factor C-terminal-like domain-containing protein [Microbacterium sp. GXF7504]